MASAPSNLISQSFPNSIAEKLDDSNYLRWRQHVKPVIKSHKLQRFIVNPVVSPRNLTEDDRIADHVNPLLIASRPNASCLAAVYVFEVCVVKSSRFQPFLLGLGQNP